MSLKMIALSLLSTVFVTVSVTGCASSKMKERKEQRDKVAAQAKLYCEFINGDVYPDIDVALNLEMAKRCDSEKPFSMTNYKTSAENPGVIFCCSTVTPKAAAPAAVFDKGGDKPAATPAAKSSAGKAETKSDKKDGNSAGDIE